jgi:uncharacterized protein YdaU (DUF1376 family)
MPWFIRDHRAAAMTLSHVEHSAYTYLKMLLWEKGGSIADDDRAIAKALRLTIRQWQPMRVTLLAECTIAGGRITDPGIVSELAKARTNIEQKRKAGRASAAARSAQREGNGCSTAVATAVQPRAGGGAGEGISPPCLNQEEKLVGEDTRASAREGLTVIAGGAA